MHKDAPLENINYLNPCWSELTTMWYVWHNRLASPIVGFAHYRRPLNPVRLPQKGECMIYKQIRLRTGETIRDQYARCHNFADFDLMVSLVNRRYGEGNPYVKHLLTSTRMIINCCFLMRWQDFMATFSSLCSTTSQKPPAAGAMLPYGARKPAATSPMPTTRPSPTRCASLASLPSDLSLPISPPI